MVATLVAVIVTRDTRLEQAREIVNDDEQFGTATESAVAFGRVSSLLKAEGRDCGDLDEERCQSFYSAAAWSQLTAVEVLECTRPGVARARVRARKLLDALADDPRPDNLPEIVSCR